MGSLSGAQGFASFFKPQALGWIGSGIDRVLQAFMRGLPLRLMTP